MHFQFGNLRLDPFRKSLHSQLLPLRLIADAFDSVAGERSFSNGCERICRLQILESAGCWATLYEGNSERMSRTEAARKSMKRSL